MIMIGEIKVKAELDGINEKFSKQTGNIVLPLFLLKKILAYRSSQVKVKVTL
jgi:hypothetical protein